MSAPRGLVGATLLLWGLSTGHEVAGMAIAILVEAARFVGSSWRVPSARLQVLIVRDFVALAAVSFVFSIATGHMPEALYGWLRWLPPILAPIVIARALAGGTIANDIILGALRPGAAPRSEQPMPIDVNYAFASLTVVAAATGPAIDKWFYAAIATLVAWVILVRMPAGRRLAGTLMLTAAVLAGFGVHRGLSVLQGEIEEWSGELLTQYLSGKPDPFRERTRIGDLGRVKLSNRVVIRVIPEERRPPAILLREAAFERYQNGEWRSASRVTTPVPHQGETWRLSEQRASARVTLRRSLPGGEGLLALPLGTTTIENLAADGLEKLPTGAVVVKGAPRFLSMRVSYDDLSETQTTAEDLEVPELLAPTLERILAGERLRRTSAGETVAAVTLFFARKFSYALGLSDRQGRSRTIADFLLTERKGHCEYFATATVLLLRQAGIPARYTVGYAVQEYSPLDGTFIVRDRHAHAWASAFVGGRWITVDTTPARWAMDEAQAARGIFAPLLDVLSAAADRLVQWWLEASPSVLGRQVSPFLVAIALTWGTIVALAKWRRSRARVPVRPAPATLAWRRVERALATRGFARQAHETPREWARRMQSLPGADPWSAELVELAREYYRSRFDPATGATSERFVVAIREFLRRLDQPRARLAPARI